MHAVPVAITGLGLCSPLGETLAVTWEALLAGKFITDHSQAAGEYDAPRVCSLADRAARAAIAEAEWTAGDLANAALVVGTSKGPIESWLAWQSCVLGLSGIAANLNFIGGPRMTISTACASGLHALIRGAMLLGEGYSRVLVVAAESSLHPLFVGSFKRLGVIAPPDIGCRPFDQDRAGFLVSEAAAAVCLEKGEAGIQIERFAMAGDATHLISADPQGRMLRRLLTAVIDGRPLDLIHAHGTGTESNDAVELAAIQSVLGDKSDGRSSDLQPNLYSHKGALGHSLGAAGLVSVVLNCLCHRHGCVPPNARTRRPMAMEQMRFSSGITRRDVGRSIAVASGFGGAGAAITLTGALFERFK